MTPEQEKAILNQIEEAMQNPATAKSAVIHNLNLIADPMDSLQCEGCQ